MKHSAAAMLGLLGTLACSSVVRTIPKLDATQAAPGQHEPRLIRVGTARVDVTPPPGPATFGHGPDALATQGYWTRIECRVFVIEAVGAAARERFAIVPCDLPAISYALYRDVATRASATVPGDHLLLTATHTHAGPAHYFEAPAYSGVLSTRRPGFDDEMLTFISERITRGIAAAAAHLVDAELRWTATDVWGLSRNRSLDAFELNGMAVLGNDGKPVCPSVAGIPAPKPTPEQRAALEKGACLHLGSACEAIDPMLQTLEFREKSQRPLGSITFFAMHPTVLPAHTRLFGADVFGVASRELERLWRIDWADSARARGLSVDSDPLAAIVNTNEGDIVPAWAAGDVPEALAMGRHLAERAWRARAAGGPYLPAAIIGIRTAEADFHRATDVLKIDPDRPAILGQGSSHGGSDHRASVDDITARLPDWSSPGGAQEPKAPLLGGGQLILASPTGFPSRLPFELLRIADRWIAGVPAEVTVTTGRRIRAAVAQASGAAPEHTLIAGLANGYMQYIATCEEFQLQRYEGASTLYGARSAAFIASIQSTLACELGAACKASYPPGVHAPPFEAYDIAPDVNRTGERLPELRPARAAVAQRACRLPRAGTPAFCFRWLDVAPGNLPLAARDRSPGPWLRVRRADASETLRWDPKDPRSFVDDWADNFEVRARAQCADDRFSYTALFSPSAKEWGGMDAAGGAPAQRPRYVLFTPGEPADRFNLPFDHDTPLCRRDEALFCLDEFDSPEVIPSLACERP